MKIDSKAVTERLEAIRDEVGAARKEFVPLPPSGRVDKDLPTVEAVEALFHPSGFLIHAGRPVFAYIRDHIWGEYSSDPEDRKRIHFTVCNTLVSMKHGGRFERYRLTNRDDNRYLVEVGGAYGERSRELDGQILYPCRHCLANVAYHCYRTNLHEREKGKIVRAFEAKEAFRLLWQQFDIFRRQTAGLKSASLPAGYTPDFDRISRAIRQRQNFTCEECGVRLSSHQRLVDTHHEDGDKSNNKYDNLRCLCKLCHAGKHPHYLVSSDVRRIIKEARKVQGIF